jgi:hypothetical protein
MPKHFIKRKEDFACFNCGTKVSGTGYTNHCPNCLWSLHLDASVPGDRESSCGGKMEPVEVEAKADEYILFHQCKKCGKKSRNKASENDSFEAILKLSQVVTK